MTAANSSAIFDVWEALTERIDALSFPAAEGWPEAPMTWFGDPWQPNPDENGQAATLSAERVCVIGKTDASSVDWAAIGQLSQAERFAVSIWIVSTIPGRTSTQVRDRLRDLTAALYADLRVVQAGTRSGADQPAQFAGYPIWQFIIAKTDPIVVGGESGYEGLTELVVACQFRINTPPVP